MIMPRAMRLSIRSIWRERCGCYAVAIPRSEWMARMRRQQVLSISIIAALTGVACRQSQPPAPPPASQPARAAAPAPEDRHYTIGFSQIDHSDPWRAQMDKDIQKYAGEHHEITLITKDAQNDAAAQEAQVKEFVA